MEEEKGKGEWESSDFYIPTLDDEGLIDKRLRPREIWEVLDQVRKIRTRCATNHYKWESKGGTCVCFVTGIWFLEVVVEQMRKHRAWFSHVPWPGADANCYVQLTDLSIPAKNAIMKLVGARLDRGMCEEYAWNSQTNEIIMVIYPDSLAVK